MGGKPRRFLDVCSMFFDETGLLTNLVQFSGWWYFLSRLGSGTAGSLISVNHRVEEIFDFSMCFSSKAKDTYGEGYRPGPAPAFINTLTTVVATLFHFVSTSLITVGDTQQDRPLEIAKTDAPPLARADTNKLASLTGADTNKLASLTGMLLEPY
eukprot:scaffold2499_cov125-Cylindrotheca_fusiformis.AAC.7